MTEARTATLPATAVAASLARLRARARPTLLFAAILCGAIGLLLSAFSGGHLGRYLVYSYSIGGCCLALTEIVRLLLAAASDLQRRRSGLAPDPDGTALRWGGAIPAVIVANLFGPILGLALGDLLSGDRVRSLLELDAVTARVTLTVSLFAMLLALFVISAGERVARSRAQAEAALRLAAENELRLLQSQLEPHMLFNTLANLRVLIALDPPRAQAMLDRLIAFLRGTLGASRVASHPLAAEFAHLSDYLALMEVRMGPRLQVSLDLPEPLRDVAVPPLLLQPLVENSIKHGLEPQVAGGRIHIAARAEAGCLLLTVRDDGAGLAAMPAPAPGSGFGLQQVRQRLATLHGAAATLKLDAMAGGGTLATVTLPLPRP